MMIKKIRYFMEKDTRRIVDNLTKVFIDEDTVVITYTVISRKFDDETINAIKYYKSRNTMIIYDHLKKYNYNVYAAFIEWANEKEIEIDWDSIGKDGNEHERTRCI